MPSGFKQVIFITKARLFLNDPAFFDLK